MTNQAAEGLKNKKNRLEAEINELERMASLDTMRCNISRRCPRKRFLGRQTCFNHVLWTCRTDVFFQMKKYFNCLTQIYDLESEYFGQSEVTAFGTVTKGLEGYLTSKNAQLKTKGRSFQVEDRLFSLSSAKSQATKDHHMQKTFGDDGFDGRRSSARKKWLGES